MKEKVGISVIALLLLLISCNKEDFVWNLEQIERLPSLTLEGVTDITNTGVTVRSIIENSGSADVTARGVCWGLNQNPTVSGNKSIDGSGAGSFTSTITSLTPNTTYWVRSYATNSVGTAYGNQVSFTTTNVSAALPSLTTKNASNITSYSAELGGNVTTDGGSSVTARGVCWGLNQNPTVSGNKSINGSGTGSFTSTITSLTPNTTYWVRSYATNSVGTAYGSQITFSTPNITCNISATTTGTTYSMQTPSQSNFSQGDSYTITMYSSVYLFGQASSVTLYDDDDFIYSFGSWLVFSTSNNTRTFTLPSSIPVSNCYNVRVVKGSDLYVSPTFTIVP